MVVRTSTPAIGTGYRGIDAAVMSNSSLGALVLSGKGGDILEFRDRRTEMDAPCRAHHNWEPPGNRCVPADASEAIELTLMTELVREPSECVRYYQPTGGVEGAPHWGRNDNVGLEPTTAYPLGGLLEAQRANRTEKTLAPAETIGAVFTARTYGGVDAVSPAEGIAAGGG